MVTERHFQSHWGWQPRGIRLWSKKRREWPRKRLRQAECGGRFRRWWTLRAMRGGGEWPREQAKIHFWAQRWREPTFADIKANAWIRLTVSWHASNTT